MTWSDRGVADKGGVYTPMPGRRVDETVMAGNRRKSGREWQQKGDLKAIWCDVGRQISRGSEQRVNRKRQRHAIMAGCRGYD